MQRPAQEGQFRLGVVDSLEQHDLEPDAAPILPAEGREALEQRLEGELRQGPVDGGIGIGPGPRPGEGRTRSAAASSRRTSGSYSRAPLVSTATGIGLVALSSRMMRPKP